MVQFVFLLPEAKFLLTCHLAPQVQEPQRPVTAGPARARLSSVSQETHSYLLMLMAIMCVFSTVLLHNGKFILI